MKLKLEEEDLNKIKRKARRQRDIDEGLYDGRLSTKRVPHKSQCEDDIEDVEDYLQDVVEVEEITINKSNWRTE